MIRNKWYAVLDSQELGKKPIGVTRLNEKLVFWRDEKGKAFCARDRCAHRGAQLSAGKVIDGKLRCPFHGFEYSGEGAVVTIPAMGKSYDVPEHYKVNSYRTYESHSFIWVFWGDAEPEKSGKPQYFEDIDDTFSFGRLVETWNVHYSRAIENQLDPMHVPFVHHNTIGRAHKTIVDGPIVKWVSEDQFFFFVHNRKEDGTLARKPEDLPEPDMERDFRLSFKFPNLWQNYLSAKARATIAFVPVDEENTKIYLRFYQNFITVPIVRDIFNTLAMRFNRAVLHQDRRVVLTQRPKKTALKMGENLTPGDLPIIEYRKRRDELLRAS